MPQTATIKSLPAAFAMMKAMQAEGVEWGEDYRGAAQQALTELLEGRMDQLIHEHLERMAELGTITFGIGASRGTFATAGGGAETFGAGDRLAIINEDPADATLADLSITFLGKRT
jgi:hypothetical protein